MDGNVTLTLTSDTNKSNTSTKGVRITAVNTSTRQTEALYTASDLLNSYAQSTIGYWVNTNYITSVTLNTASTLDVSSYEPAKDYTTPFVSLRDDGTSVGRMMFQGDSITHGVEDASYRWQFFKILVDNGIENEIVGPLSGYYSTPTTSDVPSTGTLGYGGEEFVNVHLAQASGRTHNIISGMNTQSGVNYGGNSTASASDTYNCNTYVCLMGTNDLLSDSGYTTTDFCTKMVNLVGGSVRYNEGEGYTWEAGDTWGNMGTIVSDSLRDEGDTMYVMSVPTWGNHANSNDETYHVAVQEYNAILQQWVEAYSASSGKNVVYVESNRGLVDLTASTSFTGNDAFFRAPGTTTGSDGLHPNEQGSLILAGNLARAMGIGGRTGGLLRSSADSASDGWTSVEGSITLGSGATQTVEGASFSEDTGYTIDFDCVVGDGAANGWASADNGLSLTLGDGANGGTLKITEGYIMWGSKVLFCQDNSLSGNESIRIAWNRGDSNNNVLSGYYVWLGDMLIGQGLDGSSAAVNGISLTSTGLDSTVSRLSYTNGSYAPTTTLLTSEANAYVNRSNPLPNHDSDTPASFGVDFTGATETTVNSAIAITSNETTDVKRILNTSSGWFGVVSGQCTGDIDAKVKDGVTSGASFIGILNGGKAKTLTMVVDNATINNGSYSDQEGAIIGTFSSGNNGASTAEHLRIEVNGGEVKGDILGGSVLGACDLGKVSIYINQGAVSGTVYGGSKVSAGQVGDVDIQITGGYISGDVKAGGTNGTVTGNTSITVTGGVIGGNIDAKTNATGNVGGTSSVRIDGNKASIGGDIKADKVTLANIGASSYSDTFDQYSGTIHASVLELDHVTTDLKAQVSSDLSEILLVNESVSSLKTDARVELSSLNVGVASSLSLYHTGDTFSEANESTLVITNGTATFGSGARLNANLSLLGTTTLTIGEGGLTMGSTVELGDSLLLGNSVLPNTSLLLFSDVESLVLAGSAVEDGTSVDATDVFSNVQGTITYSGGNVTLAIASPEPGTATLSLLALIGLVARRRRKQN
ncbi:MAG: SGNH/GDSL hydrolase family protein [Akkermansia sp.]